MPVPIPPQLLVCTFLVPVSTPPQLLVCAFLVPVSTPTTTCVYISSACATPTTTCVYIFCACAHSPTTIYTCVYFSSACAHTPSKCAQFRELGVWPWHNTTGQPSFCVGPLRCRILCTAWCVQISGRKDHSSKLNKTQLFCLNSLCLCFFPLVFKFNLLCDCHEKWL